MAAQFGHAALIRFNRDFPQLTAATPRHYLCFQEPLEEQLLSALQASNDPSPSQASARASLKKG